MNTFDSELTFGTSSVYVGCFSSQIIWAWTCQRSPMSRGSRKNKLSNWFKSLLDRYLQRWQGRSSQEMWVCSEVQQQGGQVTEANVIAQRISYLEGLRDHSFNKFGFPTSFQQIAILKSCLIFTKELQLPLCSNQASMQKGPTTKKHCYFCSKSPARKGALLDSLP